MIGLLITLLLFGGGAIMLAWGMARDRTSYNELETGAVMEGLGILFMVASFVFALGYAIYSLF